MVRPTIKIDQKRCLECGTEMKPVKFKRPFAKLCPECKGDRVQGNHELREIYKHLQKLRKEKPIPEEDWGHLNVKCNDRQIWKY